ncbi:ABC transporter ATP-binding protein [Phormidium tenue]|jgi:ATP-binding cassette subfamily B protein|uniref:ABC transporter ATP-binding protein n=1 Tax=Phormidium tenue FACHB-1050 TaxID=2692857 RepID=A0ABR8C7N3_9CYAN|nr:ABC transporter ATP-binding protein [Phormidium tenue]MBD2316782.1 ABC transporter ATP-binding protein [Phormidium tenue FACHB-1050]
MRDYVYPQRFLIAKAFLCTLVFIGTMPLLAELLGRVAQALGKGDVNAIIQIAIFTVVMFVFRGLGQYGQDSMMAQAALNAARDLRVDVYSHLQTLDLDYFAESRTGDLSYRLTEDIDRIGEVIGKFFHQFIPSVLQLIFVLAYMIYLNWILTLTTLAVAPLIALLIAWFGDRMLSLSRRSQDQVSNLAALLSEIFSGIRLVRAFATESYEVERFKQESEQNSRRKYAADRVRAIQYPVIGFLEAAGICFLFLLGGWLISNKWLLPEQFVAFGAGVALLIDPIANTTGSYNEIKQAEASVDRIFEIFEIQPVVTEKPNAIALPEVTGKVEYVNVGFHYQSDRPVLTDINLVANQGEAIALVGASGAGKSTLMNLLMRFHDVNTGKILIDGYDIRDVQIKSLRQQLALVPQENILFSGTVASNIAFGQKAYDTESVEQAARIANAHDFIMELPQGYDTWVGERGVNLSGGQRQRISIARAVLHNPKILILDEATSALDAESESLVQEALQRLMQGRTVFIIAHRLATIRNSDRIIVLEQGQIVESGTHDELLQKAGRYAQLHSRQFDTIG